MTIKKKINNKICLSVTREHRGIDVFQTKLYLDSEFSIHKEMKDFLCGSVISEIVTLTEYVFSEKPVRPPEYQARHQRPL